MFENFRKGIADAANALPKGERKKFLNSVQETDAYKTTREEHLNDIQEKNTSEQEKLKELANKEGRVVEFLNGQTLEFGSTVGYSAWDDIPKILARLNDCIKDDGKPWRVATKEEYELFLESVIDRITENHDKRRAFIDHGFKTEERYWTSNLLPTEKEGGNGPDITEPRAYYLDTNFYFPGVHATLRADPLLIHCVR